MVGLLEVAQYLWGWASGDGFVVTGSVRQFSHDPSVALTEQLLVKEGIWPSSYLSSTLGFNVSICPDSMYPPWPLVSAMTPTPE